MPQPLILRLYMSPKLKKHILKLMMSKTARQKILAKKSACMHAKSLQSSLTLCDPMNHSLPDSSVHEILQAGILEWVAMPADLRKSIPLKIS